MDPSFLQFVERWKAIRLQQHVRARAVNKEQCWRRKRFVTGCIILNHSIQQTSLDAGRYLVCTNNAIAGNTQILHCLRFLKPVQ